MREFCFKLELVWNVTLKEGRISDEVKNHVNYASEKL